MAAAVDAEGSGRASEVNDNHLFVFLEVQLSFVCFTVLSDCVE